MIGATYLGFVSGTSWGQLRPVPEELLGERVIAVVPLVGTGKAGDPIRPKYAPVPQGLDKNAGVSAQRAEWDRMKPEDKTDFLRQRIQSFTYVLSDDKKHAIVEFVAGDRKAFADLLKDKDVQAYEPKDYQSGKAKRDGVEVELKKWKKDFSLNDLRAKGF